MFGRWRSPLTAIQLNLRAARSAGGRLAGMAASVGSDVLGGSLPGARVLCAAAVRAKASVNRPTIAAEKGATAVARPTFAGSFGRRGGLRMTAFGLTEGLTKTNLVAA